jgi:hypothetical protein
MPYQQKLLPSGGYRPLFKSDETVEYMACGRAILSSNLPVLQEILSPKMHIITSDDREAWTEAFFALG